MKDNFSTQSSQYAQYRPTYPKEVFDYLKTLIKSPQYAWDCGTGNGQIAIHLSSFFHQVFATDISQSQIDNAIQAQNIIYSLQPAEKTNFPNDIFNLIIVGQAIHWFDFEAFYQEVKRVSCDNALLVVIGYDLLSIDNEVDIIIRELYTDIIGKYWDKERHYVDEKYKTIPFPFEEIKVSAFHYELEWNLESLIGYLNTWSAVKHYVQANKKNPVELIYPKLQKQWNEIEKKRVSFPLLLRIGKIK